VVIHYHVFDLPFLNLRAFVVNRFWF